MRRVGYGFRNSDNYRQLLLITVGLDYDRALAASPATPIRGTRRIHPVVTPNDPDGALSIGEVDVLKVGAWEVEEAVASVIWSSAGDGLLAAASSGRLWWVSSRLQRHRHKLPGSRLTAPSDGRIVNCSRSGIRVLRLRPWQVLAECVPSWPVENIACHRSGELLATVGPDGLQVRRTGDLQVIAEAAIGGRGIDWLRDSELIVATSDGGVTMLNLHRDSLTK